MKPFICAGNWKMNKGPLEATEFLQELVDRVPVGEQSNFIVFPSMINLLLAQDLLGETKIGWGPQNVYFEASGAFTGENSAEVAAQMGATHVLIGHSERRHLFNESDQVIAKKVEFVQKLNLVPVVCVGEHLQQRQAGQTEDIIREQLLAALAQCDITKTIMIAYEPVWAIGTGKVASPEQAELAHQQLRLGLQSIVGEVVAQSTSILYGGSVKPDNARQLSQKKNIDGFLIGGASLQVESFLEIAANANVPN